MQEFLLVIYRDLTSDNPAPSPEQMREAMKPYQEWVASIAAQNRLVAPPKRWDVDGRVIKQVKAKDHVYAGPYAEGKESIGGLFLIKAKDYDEAVEIARGCPIIKYGAIVEIRMAISAA
ncbi:transcription initiation protein [Chitinophaga agrisoli]|uniref:Transcription initiation protein n=1 Tax=Chitinophaga agrisoli TaxID=2607653 RepID=A0A5B2VKU9_9BACT|nr:YciI family protein [Chitinophaga agrisoli]KAA2239595.1 transcription initiation protein [Chitinophaga agrisoli]